MIFPRNDIIQTHELTYSFGRYQVLDSINLEVPIGCIFAFLGPNGAGKSTTIKTLPGLLHTGYGSHEEIRNVSINKTAIE